MQYLGMVKWDIKHKRIKLTPNIHQRDRMDFISFRLHGTEESREECEIYFSDFIKTHGVLQQWVADGVDDVNQELWDAASELWGFPVLERVGAGYVL